MTDPKPYTPEEWAALDPVQSPLGPPPSDAWCDLSPEMRDRVRASVQALAAALDLLSQAVDDWNDADADIDIEADRAGLEEPPPRPEPQWVTQAEALLRAAGLRP